MGKATSLARRVGRMTYEQVRILFDENRAELDAHSEAVNRGEYCPTCKWHVEQEYKQCAMVKTLQKGMDIFYHQKGCSVCQTIVREGKYLDSCVYSDSLYNAEQIYARRMNYLENRERVTV